MVQYPHQTTNMKRPRSTTSQQLLSLPRLQSAVRLSVLMLQLLLLVLLACASTVNGQNITMDDILEQRYNMSGPVFEYGNYSFTLEFTVSDYTVDGAVEYRLYDGHNCKDGGLGDDVWNNETESFDDVEGDTDITESIDNPLNAVLRPDLSPLGDGTGVRQMKLTLDLDAETLTNSTIYQDGNTSGIVEFCVRFSVYNMAKNLPESEEVNFIEVPVRLTIGLTDDFEVQISSRDSDLVVQLAYEDNAVESYLCDNDANIVFFDSASQGEEIRVCVTPTAETLEQGAFLRQIEEFTFSRDEFSQVAIAPETGGAPNDELTVVSCFPGATVCAFETLLNSDFFKGGVGIVFGTGTAYVQIGEDAVETSRRRQERFLQQEGGISANDLLAARPTTFPLEVVVVPEDGTTDDDIWDLGTSDATCRQRFLTYRFLVLVGGAVLLAVFGYL